MKAEKKTEENREENRERNLQKNAFLLIPTCVTIKRPSKQSRGR